MRLVGIHTMESVYLCMCVCVCVRVRVRVRREKGSTFEVVSPSLLFVL